MIERVELTIRQPGHPDRALTLSEGATRLGRAEDNELVLADVGVSRRHARILVTRDRVRVEDLGSGNGTYYRGYRIKDHLVENGDEILIDPFTLRFDIAGKSDFADDEPTVKWAGDVEQPRLDVIVGNGLAQSSWPITDRGLTMGRSEQRDIILPDPAASRHHCTVLANHGDYVVRDMGSANGVFVNAKRVREAVLREGDRIRIGNTEFRFTTGSSAGQDTSTQSLPRLDELEESEWTEHELSLPLPEVNRPVSHGATHRQKKRSMLPLLLGGGAFAGVVGLGFIGLVIAAVLLYPQYVDETVPPQPPDWALTGVSTPQNPEVSPLFDAGVESLKAGDHAAALETFYQLLMVSPGNPAGERLAYLAGEFLVLSSMQPKLEAVAQKAEAREQLLAEAQRRGRRGREAREQLQAQFGDDPAVQAALGELPDLGPLREKAAAASARGDWSAAAPLHAELLEQAQDAATIDASRQASAVARRARATSVTDAWIQASDAESSGRWTEARQGWNALLQRYPGHPSARLHLERLDHRAAVALARAEATTDPDTRKELLQQALELSSGSDTTAQAAREALVALRGE